MQIKVALDEVISEGKEVMFKHCESKWRIGLVLQPKHNTKKTKIE